MDALIFVCYFITAMVAAIAVIWLAFVITGAIMLFFEEHPRTAWTILALLVLGAVITTIIV